MEVISGLTSFGVGTTALAEIWIGSVVKCSLLLLLALFAVAVGRRLSAATRHFMLTLALSGALLIPVGSALWIVMGATPFAGVNAVEIVRSTVAVVSKEGSPAQSYLALPGWWSLALLIWLGGVLLLTLRNVAGHIHLRRILRQAQANEDPALQRLFEKCVAATGIRRVVRLLVHPRQPVPFTCGLRRPVVVLTVREVNCAPDQTRRILLHELAHVGRLDVAANAIARWATVLFWFNPLVWIAARQMHREEERACDDQVLQFGESAADYAELLLNYARTLRQQLTLLPEGIMFIRAQSLRARIHSLLDPRPRVRAASGVLLTGIVAVALGSALLLSCVRTPTAEQKAAETPRADAAPSPEEFIAVDEMPEFVTSVQPEYPKALADAHINGSVWIRALVAIDGTVAEARVVNPNQHEEFNTAAIAAAYKSEFKPARKDGKPVPVWVTYQVQFRTEGGTTDDDC